MPFGKPNTTMSYLFEDMNLKKTRTKDSAIKAKARTKDSGFVFKDKQGPRTTSLKNCVRILTIESGQYTGKCPVVELPDCTTFV